ncbi:uncharacterized protein [Misgurnus anguillicaudatus]|uniref:uncharacterized protein isoform X1 n=1 Tax=Misgurnus anguillicaudatus TaxID=75329 RepID=UPI003CCFD93A
MMKILRNETSQLFSMQAVNLKFILVILWLITGEDCRTVTVQTGGSVIIPCHYESKYTQHKKYWCYDTRPSYDYCSFLVYSNATKGNVSVIDHPDQSLFTVTMRDLQEQNTGTYWCAIKIEGAAYDVKEWFYITIQSAPDLSVMSSSVTVDEGGNISVQCLYTSTYKNKDKQWCRYKDKRCYTVGRSDTSQFSIDISDDRRGSLTVVMSGLMKKNSGWYYCSVGHLQAPFQLTVTVAKVSVGNSTPVKFIKAEPTTGNSVTDGEPTTVTTLRSSLTSESNQLKPTTQSHLSTASHLDSRHTALPTITPTPNNNNQIPSSKEPKRQYLKLWLLLIVLILLLILVTVTSEILRNKHKRKNNHTTHEKKDEASDKDDLVNSSSVNPECDVMYISGIKHPKTEADDSVNSSSVNPECDVTYSSVITLAKTEAYSPADVEETVIYSSLCE